MSKIYQIYGHDAHEMTKALLNVSEAIKLVPPGGSVALKPNLVIAGTPESGATTHPGVLSGCIAYFRENGVEDISVIEGSWIGDETMRAMRTAGYDRVCREYNVPFFDLKKDATRTVKTMAGPIDICCKALDAGLLVDLPVLKGHGQTIMTCALKNLKGCLPDREKRHFHSMGLHKPIAALAAALKPGLIVVDGICGDLDFEEGGNPVQMNRMYLGTDPVQIDTYGLRLMGLNMEDVPYIGMAAQFRAGKAEYDPKDLVELNRPEEAPVTARPRGVVAGLVKNVQADQACSACYASLVRALYTTRCGSKLDIRIGQGWKGKEFDALGIGNCCRGGTRCVKGCPPTAEDVARVLEELHWK